MKQFVVVAFLSVSIVFTAFTPDSGKELPELTLKDLKGKPVNLADYGKNGKPTIISFWATWCKPCINELDAMADLYEDWIDDYDVEIIAVSLDDQRTKAKVRPYINSKGWDFEVLLDVNRDSQRAFNFQSPPYLVLVNAEGQIVYKHTGYLPGAEHELEEHLEAL